MMRVYQQTGAAPGADPSRGSHSSHQNATNVDEVD